MAALLLADLRDLRAATSTPDDTTAWLRALGFFWRCLCYATVASRVQKLLLILKTLPLPVNTGNYRYLFHYQVPTASCMT